VTISFFIPAYNCANTIQEAVESIMEGNLSAGDEVVVVDDGSTDNTAEILEKLKDRYSYLRVLHHPRNKGGGAARNTAIENARHPILFCLDSDNVLTPGSIPFLKESLMVSNADVACFQEIRFFQSTTDQVTHYWRFNPGVFPLAGYLTGNAVPGASGNYMYTKKSWLKAGGYPEFGGSLDTWGFGFRQLATGSKMMVVPNSYYFHRWGHDSYWIRGSRAECPSLGALRIIIPFLDLIVDEDVDYVMSREGRYTWFDLSKRPLRLKSGETGQSGQIIVSKYSLLMRVFRRLQRVIH
jgi:glycosyltransferase involved in cell wall biosynthesis